MTKRNKRRLLMLAVVADVVFHLNGCILDVTAVDGNPHHDGTVEVASSFTRTLAVSGQTAFRLVGGNGEIEILGVPGLAEVRVDAVLRVRSNTRRDAQEALNRLHVKVEMTTGRVEIRTVQPQNTQGRTFIIDYQIRVPSGFTVSVANGNGPVRLEGIWGDVELTNGNGNVSLIGLEGNSWVALGNGEVSSSLSFLPAGGQAEYAVGNGTIHLSLPSQTSATFEAEVGNGTWKVEGLDLREVVATLRRVHGLLGDGNGSITLAVGNGTIEAQGR